MTTDEIAARIAHLIATRPFDGRPVMIRESRGGWRFDGLSGVCVCLSECGRHMVLTVEDDPDEYWRFGTAVLVQLDEETRADFDVPN